jgi:hypothetical protein
MTVRVASGSADRSSRVRPYGREATLVVTSVATRVFDWQHDDAPDTGDQRPHASRR